MPFRYEQIPLETIQKWEDAMNRRLDKNVKSKFVYPSIQSPQTYRASEMIRHRLDPKPFPLGVSLWKGGRVELLELMGDAAVMGYHMPKVLLKDLPEYFEVATQNRRVRVIHEQLTSLKVRWAAIS